MSTAYTPFREALGPFAAVWGIGFLPQAISPHVVHVLARDHGLSDAAAGTIQTLELAAVAATALAFAPRIARLSARNLALTGAAVSLCMHAASAIVQGFPILVGLRVGAGIGAGLALAAGNAVAAAHPEPERLYGRMFVLMGIAYAVVFLAMGNASQRYGSAGVFGCEAVWIALLLPALRMLPALAPALRRAEGSLHPERLRQALVVMTALTAFACADVAVWSFAGQIAAGIGMADSTIAWTLGASSIAALLGGILVVIVGGRHGRTVPIALGLAFVTTCALTSTRTSVAPAFIVGLVLYQGGYTFLASFLYATAAALDKHGRVLVATAGATLAGAALGPHVGGRLAERYGYDSIGVYYVATMLVVAALMLPLARVVRHAPATD